MKRFLSLVLGLVLSLALVVPAMADELKVNIGIESGTRTTQVVGADVYATIDGKLYEITVAPDDMAFKMNGKFGALHLVGFWQTNAKLTKIIGTDK